MDFTREIVKETVVQGIKFDRKFRIIKMSVFGRVVFQVSHFKVKNGKSYGIEYGISAPYENTIWNTENNIPVNGSHGRSGFKTLEEAEIEYTKAMNKLAFIQPASESDRLINANYILERVKTMKKSFTTIAYKENDEHVSIDVRNVGTKNPKWPIQMTIRKIVPGKKDPKKYRTQFFTVDIPAEHAKEFIKAVTVEIE